MAKTSTLCLGDAMPQTGMPAILTNNRNRLSNATYDSAGNITQEYGTGFSYDAEGRLVSGSGSAYTYDGMGERVAKPGKLYWKGVGSTALVETDANDLNPTKYIFFNGARIARIDPGTTTAKYYVTDNIGSTALVTDASGNVLNESMFFPYGVERVITQNDSANNYKFTGKERDQETGLDDFGARYYDSALGRFMTPDWDAKAAAVPYAAFGDPQTLNLYAYVENGPLNKVDADGHSPEVNWTSTGLESGQGQLCGSTGCGTDAPVGATIVANAIYEAEQDAQSGQTDPSKPQIEQAPKANGVQQSMAGSQMPNLGPAPKLPTDITIIPTFSGSTNDVAGLKAGWSELMQSATARSDARIAVVKDGSLTINSANKDAYFDPRDKSLNVDPNFHPRVMTTAGPQASPTSVILGHELGHKLGGLDAGPGHMDNVNTFENPIRRDLGLPGRTAYPPVP